MEALDFVIQLIQVPAVIIGLIALIGLLVQKAPLGQVVGGTMRTMLSLLIIGGGIGVLINGLVPIQGMFEAAMPTGGVTTFVSFDEAVVGAVQSANVGNLGLAIGLTMLFGYAFHLLLARITPFRYVYLTGHMIWVHAGAYAILFHSFGLNLFWTVLLASLLDGAYMTFAPALAQPFMRKITGSDDVAFGHGQTLLNVLAGWVGKFVGKPEDSAEDIKMPEKLNFFRDVAISTSIVMLVVSFIAAIWAGIVVGFDVLTADIAGGQNWIVFTLLVAFGFTAGMLIMLYGVRMLIAEIVPAFSGISNRLIPNAKPALDVPVIFSFAPNSLIIGLIAGFIGQAIASVILVLIGWPIALPSIIVAFFASGAGAIFGNATGGRRGAWVGGFLWSFVCWFLVSYAYHFNVFGDLSAVGAPALGFTVPDAIVPAIIINLIGRIFGLV
jgi:PTS system ascorbate-specific IIC component